MTKKKPVEEPKRWHAKLTYKFGNGEIEIYEKDMEEIADLQEIVEGHYDWRNLLKAEVTYNL